MISPSDLRRLAAQRSGRMLSLYLLVDPAASENQAPTPVWRSWLRSTIKEIEQALHEDETDIWFEIRSRLEDFLESFVPDSKSLALFYGKDINEVYELSISVKNYASFGEPSLTPLLWALDDDKPRLVIAANHEHVCFWVAAGNRILHEEKMTLALRLHEWRKVTATMSSGHVKAGSHQDRFSDRIEEQRKRFYKEAVEQISRLREDHLVEHVVLVGNPEAVRAIQKFMSDTVVIGNFAPATRQTSSEILEKSASIMSEYQQQQDTLLVEDVFRLAKSGGRGALGDDVLEEMKQRHVELLILPWDAPNMKLVDMFTNEALASGTEIKLVSGKAAERLIVEGGVAARLYYRQPG